MIEVTDVSHHYGLRPVLSHLNLHVPAGKLVVVMGPNGVGKSTLLGNFAPFGGDLYNAGLLSLFDSIIGDLYP